VPTIRSRVRSVVHRPDDLTVKLDQTRSRIVQLEAERGLLRSQVKEAKNSERSVVAELRRLRTVAFSDQGAQPPEAARRYLVVVSPDSGAGPIAVQDALNGVPGVVIRDESGGLLHDLFRLHRNTLHHQNRLGLGSQFMPPTNAWWGIDGYPQDLALREIRYLATDLLLRPDARTQMLGFVETSWPDQPVADYLRFIRGVFPGARILLCSRLLEESADPDPLDAELRVAVDDLGPDGFELRDQDIAAGPDGLRPLFAWLQLESPSPSAAG
jgi:hypothetical protein